MKPIGLIGGLTYVSTIEYYRYLNQLANEKLGGAETVEVIIHSVNFGEIKKFTEYIMTSIVSLPPSFSFANSII